MTPEQWRTVHRGTGLTAAIFVAFLCVTGILLNHAHELGLDGRYVKSAFLLDWYGIGPKEAPFAFAAGETWVVQIGDRVYLNAKEIPEQNGRLAGAVWQDGTVAVALQDRVLLLTEEGALMEVLRDVPQDIEGIGVSGDARLILRGAGGRYAADLNAGSWERAEVDDIEWSLPASAPAPLLDLLMEQYRGQDLTVERVLLDLHSGRIFGWSGRLVVDAAALALLSLVLSGIWLWWKRPRFPPD